MPNLVITTILCHKYNSDLYKPHPHTPDICFARQSQLIYDILKRKVLMFKIENTNISSLRQAAL